MAILKVRVDGGYLVASESGDTAYPGICVEFVADDVNEDALSIPTVLIEKPTDGDLRVLVWGDENDEDYTAEIKFD